MIHDILLLFIIFRWLYNSQLSIINLAILDNIKNIKKKKKRIT